MLNLVGKKVLYMSVNDTKVQVGWMDRVEPINNFGKPYPIIADKDNQHFYVFGPIIEYNKDGYKELLELSTDEQWEIMNELVQPPSNGEWLKDF